MFQNLKKKFEFEGKDENANKLGDEVGSGNEGESENVGTSKDECRTVCVEKSIEESQI